MKTRTKKQVLKKKQVSCFEFEDFIYDRKKKSLKVCIHHSGKFVQHNKYQTILYKELNKTLKEDMIYIDKKDHKDYKEFIKKY